MSLAEIIETMEYGPAPESDAEARGWLAASYGHAGQTDAASAALEEFLTTGQREMAVFPGRKLSAWHDYWHGAIEYSDDDNFQHLYDGLRKAGLGD